MSISYTTAITNLSVSASEILNSIEWTKKLNQEFEKNHDEIKAWQYIGLSNGVFRFYPGMITSMKLFLLKTQRHLLSDVI